jgi:uncharacterized membrane protein SpoIIM required for sporulation
VDVDAYIEAHQPQWRRLDELVARRRRLTGDEVDELVTLYQRTATQLSVLRSAGHDPALTARLSAQVSRARAAVTGAPVPAWRAVARFFTVAFPAMAYRARWWWLAAAAGSILVAVLLGWRIAGSPQVQAGLAPPGAIQRLVNHEFKGYYSQYTASSFAAEVWTNNVWAAALALVFGIFLGLPTLAVLYVNAANVAVDGGLMIAHGKGALFFTLILPHGMLELTAVFLAAGAGLRLGWCVIDPGRRSRAAALAQEGRASITIALGLIVVLAVSGAIEAFVTPSPLPAWARIGIGAAAEAAFLSYVAVAGRRAARAGLSADMDQAPDVVPVAG